MPEGGGQAGRYEDRRTRVTAGTWVAQPLDSTSRPGSEAPGPSSPGLCRRDVRSMGNKTGLAVAVGIAAVVCAAPTASAGEQSPSFVAQVFGGTVLNVPTTLKLSQAGFPDLVHDARWTSKSLDQPFYWALRLRWQQPDSGWELHPRA